MAYLGMKATKYYSFQYTCEHCRKTVKKTSSIASESGFNAIPPPGAKGVRINAGGRKIHGDAAKNHLINKNCPEVEKNWRQRRYPDDARKKGKCPICKEYQHWSAYYDAPPGGYGAAQKSFNADFAVGIAFVIFIVTLIIEVIFNYITSPPVEDAFLLAIFKRSSVWIGVIAATILGFAISGLLHPLYAKIQYPKWEKRKKAIEQKEHLNPTFISWEEQVHLSSFHR
jgi:hypothetical protein